MAEPTRPPAEPEPLESRLGLDHPWHPREHLRIVRKHWRLVLAGFLVVVAAVGVRTALQQPVYQATAKLLIERNSARVVNIQEVAPAGWETWREKPFFQDQVEVLLSRPLIQRAMDTANLAARKPALVRAADPVSLVRGAVTARPLPDTHFLEIQVEDADPGFTAALTNALADAYVSHTLELRVNTARDALAWLTTQVADLKTKVNESEERLQRYRDEAGLAASEKQQSLVGQKLAEFQSAYIAVKAQRLAMETQLKAYRAALESPERLNAAPAIVNSPLIQGLKTQRYQLDVEQSKLSRLYRDKHPEVLKVQSQIKEIDQKIRDESANLGKSLESEYQVLQAREAAMLATVDQYRAEAQGFARKEIEAGILKRDVDTNQQLYQLVLGRTKEIDLSRGMESTNVRVVERARVPTAPVRPRKVRVMAFGGGAGLVLGLALAFLAHYLDDRVRTAEDVEAGLGVPVFGIIPVIAGRRS